MRPTLRAIKLTFPRWLLPTAILLALLALATCESRHPEPAPVALSSPAAITADDGIGVWTAARKRAARRRCTERFADPAERRRCLATIPNDGDWGAMGR